MRVREEIVEESGTIKTSTSDFGFLWASFSGEGGVVDRSHQSGQTRLHAYCGTRKRSMWSELADSSSRLTSRVTLINQ